MSELYEGSFEGIWYHWTCGNCGIVNEVEEDIRNQETECEFCEETNEIEGSI